MLIYTIVALRKESVDRNSAFDFLDLPNVVALRKESVDRNRDVFFCLEVYAKSLSARRAWIEIAWVQEFPKLYQGRSPQGERG